MKRLLSLAVLFGMFISFVGCDSGTTTTDTKPKDTAPAAGTEKPGETK